MFPKSAWSNIFKQLKSDCFASCASAVLCGNPAAAQVYSVAGTAFSIRLQPGARCARLPQMAERKRSHVAGKTLSPAMEESLGAARPCGAVAGNSECSAGMARRVLSGSLLPRQRRKPGQEQGPSALDQQAKQEVDALNRHRRRRSSNLNSLFKMREVCVTYLAPDTSLSALHDRTSATVPRLASPRRHCLGLP